MGNKKTIRKLYDYAEEDFNIELVQTSEYQKVFERVKKKSELLKNSLSEEDYELVQDYMGLEYELRTIETMQSFVKGFSMANQFLLESLR